MNKKKSIINLSLFLAIFLIGFVSSTTYCCEKTVGENPAWCQNMPSQESCNSAFQKSASYCEATSYCRLGTCVDTSEGKCTSSTQRVCEDNGGDWHAEDKVDLPQCQLGCCLIGESAVLATQVACNKMASDYGLKIDYRASITDELTCLANANPTAKGACVFTEDYTVNCDMVTKKECNTVYAVKSAYSNVSFHESYLCSAPELNTVCAKSTKTVCKGDDVYFVDTCGNLANIYDSGKKDSTIYWSKITEPDCADGKGDKDSAKCGDCDYVLGSMCKEKETGDSVDVGEYLCKDLDCKSYKGIYSGSPTGFATSTNYPKHGEEWCASETGKNQPGESDFVLTCFNGEVTDLECDSLRQKICLEEKDEESGFISAGCIANSWRDCWQQVTAETCLENELRDCKWVNASNGWNGYYFTNDSGLMNIDDEIGGICLPKYSPGVEESADVTGSCGVASAGCNVKLKKWWILEDKEENWVCNNNVASNNCSCYTDPSTGTNQAALKIDGGQSWAKNLNQICTQMGDCGNKTNYLGRWGYATNSISINDPE